MKSISRTKILVVLVLVLLVVVPGRFAWDAMNASGEEAAQLDVQTSELETRIAAAQEVADNREDYDRRIAAARTAVPETQELSELITELDAAAARSNVRLSSGSPSTASDSDGFSNAYSLSLSVSAPPADAVRFINELRNLERLVVIDSISVNDQSTSIQARFFSQS